MCIVSAIAVTLTSASSSQLAAVTAGRTRLSSQATPCSLSALVTAGHTSRKYCSAAAQEVRSVVSSEVQMLLL